MLNIPCAVQPLSLPNAAIFRQQYFGSKKKAIRPKYPITIETKGDEHEYSLEECSSWQFPPLSGIDSTAVKRWKGEIS